ncbi:MAG TPA: hypothetical protein PKY87_01415 [Terricaulis sp.]|nr:hypothetical protein [Terricaulis sp.]
MTHVAQAARAAWTEAQKLAVFAMCIGAGMVLPLTLVSIGFQIA